MAPTNDSNITIDNGTLDEDSCVYCEGWEYIRPEDSEWVLIAVYILTFMVGLIGNTFVCLVIWRNRQMRTVTNTFIVNLSAADLAVILLCLPSTLVVDVTETWFMGRAFCKINASIMTISVSVSVLTLSALSVERWYAICHPLSFHSTVRRARVIIISIWILSFCIAIPEMIAVDIESNFDNSVLFTACYMVNWNNEQVTIFQVVLMLGLYFIPLFLMGFTYTKIAIVLWKRQIPGTAELNRHTRVRWKNGVSDRSRQRQPMMDSNGTEVDEQAESRKKAAKMLVAVVVVFGLCFLPIHMFNIFRYTGVLSQMNPSYTNIFALVAHWSTSFNSCVNPIIYNFMSDKFRKEFRMAYFMCVHCGRRTTALQRSDMYRMTYNSARTYSSRYNSNYNGNNNPENISMSSVATRPTAS